MKKGPLGTTIKGSDKIAGNPVDPGGVFLRWLQESISAALSQEGQLAQQMGTNPEMDQNTHLNGKNADKPLDF